MHVVIVGGGIAGCVALTGLSRELGRSSDVSVSLVDPKTYAEVAWANFRGLFDPSVAEQCTIPYERILARVSAESKHIQASVTSVDEATRKVTLSNGQGELHYDVLVLATGASTRNPIFCAQEPGFESRRAELKAYGDQLSSAKSVLVVGGGPIGAEVAGDVKYYATQKGNSNCQVTLVHRGAFLVPDFGETFGQTTKTVLEKNGVSVYVGSTATEVGKSDDGAGIKYKITKKGEETSSDGVVFDAELTVMATGVDPLAPEIIPNSKDGWADIDEYGRVNGCDGSVFAYGDCVLTQPKSGAKCIYSQKTIAKNICAVLSARRDRKDLSKVDWSKELKTLGKPPKMGVVTVGKGAGVALTPLFTTTWLLPAYKNKTMFLSTFTGACGL